MKNDVGAWVCTNEKNRQNRGRKKTHQPNSKIYLKDNEEFEIELFNPTNKNILAEISIDGKLASSGGIVLRAGQRFYLDCFPDTLKKFTYKTYEVENTEVSLDAIKENGKIEILFYKEMEQININLCNGTWDRGLYNTNIFNYSDNYDDNSGNYMLKTTPTTSNIEFSNISDSSSSFLAMMNCDMSLETGQVDGGLKSKQTFNEVDMDFLNYSFKKITFQLLPKSNEIIHSSVKKNKNNSNTTSKLDSLVKLKELRDSGLITRDEMLSLKKEIM